MDKKIKNTIITASILAIGGYLLYKIFKKPEQPSNDASASQTPVSTGSGTIGTVQTLSAAEYKKMANNIFDAMSGWGTNLSVIYNELAKLKNNDDVAYLIQAYGIKQIPAGKFNPVPDFKGNLAEAFANELSYAQIENINSVMANNGITVKFDKNGLIN